ncbi:DnaJ domain-containing protein [Arthrobacter sp. NicSoilB8]|uniref:J domain-containing protein n=1 Tax=Arthrobacter sp. NicSoilB8 TaxID=2830998 RepID=UPI001CC6D392|nr:DnaJ domain-containing protein [Arthrobacter sp. NicSoilB8]BCW72720.1 hypothetical protein NicSoilB8_37640 [Arthrobacter sp. NicSoilB8]
MAGRNPDPRGYYALLHVSPEASRQEIGRAFRALMRRRHPDVGHPDVGHPDVGHPDGGHPDVGHPDGGVDDGDVRAILDAFTVLRDPRTRADYDAGAGHTAGHASTVQTGTDHAGTGHAGTDHAGTGHAGTVQTGDGGRDIPVRIVRRRDPLLRVLPVHWEPGPWPGKHPRGGP